MRAEDVPQESDTTLAGGRKAMYALGADGRYHVVASSGWQVEEIVTAQAIAEFQQQAEAALARARAGRSSPLEYHMYRQRMDLLTLAQSTGMLRLRVRRHLKPQGFARLSPRLLQRYADALGISVSELLKLPPDSSCPKP